MTGEPVVSPAPVSPVDVARLEGLEARATPGEWEAGDGWVFTMPVYEDDKRLSDVLGVKFADTERQHAERLRAQANVEFIAALRNAAPSLLAAAEAVERVRARHSNGFGNRCIGCDYSWPCPTIRALDGAE